jgi:hypothetical protein
MLIKESFSEDVEFVFNIEDGVKPINVHVHVVDENNLHKVVELPFTIDGNKVRAIVPANLEFIHRPEMLVEKILVDNSQFIK